MNTYLFVWNPKKWDWTTLEQQIEDCQNSGTTRQRWSCSSHQAVKKGDRAFLATVGAAPTGIFASGYVASIPFLAEHWSGVGKNVPRVYLDLDVLLYPNTGSILPTKILKTGKLAKQHWTPQSSGIAIRPELVEELEVIWFDFLTTAQMDFQPFDPKEEATTEIFAEGTTTQMVQNRYERNPFARRKCLQHFGYHCSVCDFDFEAFYGPVGKEFIHVHHLTPIATLKTTHFVDPIKDLRPVCPNCHAMLHRATPALTIEQLKARMTAKDK